MLLLFSQEKNTFSDCGVERPMWLGPVDNTGVIDYYSHVLTLNEIFLSTKCDVLIFARVFLAVILLDFFSCFYKQLKV